jgi:hypothetical protein
MAKVTIAKQAIVAILLVILFLFFSGFEYIRDLAARPQNPSVISWKKSKSLFSGVLDQKSIRKSLGNHPAGRELGIIQQDKKIVQ